MILPSAICRTSVVCLLRIEKKCGIRLEGGDIRGERRGERREENLNTNAREAFGVNNTVFDQKGSIYNLYTKILRLQKKRKRENVNLNNPTNILRKKKNDNTKTDRKKQ